MWKFEAILIKIDNFIIKMNTKDISKSLKDWYPHKF